MNRPRLISSLLVAVAVSSGACSDGASVAAPEGPSGPAAAVEGLPSFCPNRLNQRSADQVLEDLRAALAVGDLDAAICNYDVDATLIGDGGIDTGHDQIRSTLAFTLQIWGGVQPQVVQQIETDMPLAQTRMVRVLFTVDTPCILVPDGVYTYVIRRGLIRGQTSHGFPVFNCF